MTGSITAFREQNMPYLCEQIGTRDDAVKWWSGSFDDYDVYMSVVEEK